MSLVLDKQRSEFFNLINDYIPDLLNKMSVDDELVEIKYNYLPFEYTKPQTNMKGTIYNTVKTEVYIKNKLTQESRTVLLDLLNIPIYTSTGYIINGNNTQALDVYNRATGWYVLEGKEGIEKRTLELLPNRGRKLNFICENKCIMVYTVDMNKRIPVGVFLKAITGKSYGELIDLLSSTNKFITTTLSLEGEPSRVECIRRTLGLFYERLIQGTDKQLSEIKRRLFDERYMTFGTEAKERLRRSASFAFRCLNKVLAEDIHLNGQIVKAGTTLYSKVLEEIDKTDMVQIKVYHDGRVFDLKKYPLEDNLSENEFLTAINLYANALSGFDKIDSQYELTSRCLKPIHGTILDMLENCVSMITDKIHEKLMYLDNENNSADLISITSVLPIPMVDKFLEEGLSSSNKEIQSADSNNLISSISKSFKITTDFNGNATEDMIRVQDAQHGRLDPIDSPESKKIGLVHLKTLFCDVDSSGFLRAPYLEVKDGKIVSEEPVYLTAVEEHNKYIAEWSEKFQTARVKARYNGTIISVPVEKVTYIEYTPLQSMSPARAQIPFQNHSAPKRLLMGSNHLKQSVPVMEPERPLVGTGAESILDIGYYTAKDILQHYYDENDLDLEAEEKESFLNLELTLVNTRNKIDYRQLEFTAVYVNKNNMSKMIAPSLTIPFLQKTSVESMNTYRINIMPGNKYKGEDIVAYNIGFDIRKYNIEKLIDYGHYKLEDKEFDKSIALGKNIVVGFKTFEGSTIDDAIAISSELVEDGTFTSVTLKEKEYELIDNKEYVEKFGFVDSKQREYYMNANGLPMVGTYLKAGSVVIAKFSGKKVIDINSERLESIKDKSIVLDTGEEGEVVFSEIRGNTATVILASLSPIEIGDKLAGRYGNKGVVAKVVRKEHMPFDPVTGLRVQIMLNPLGVPSRMNISQILEVVLGLSMRKQGKIAIVSPYNSNGLDFVKEQAEKTNTTPMKLRDGRTGLWVKRPINVGVMYMLKLEHMVKKKIHSINLVENVDPRFLQPKKGKKNKGGQAIGEMETWCLSAVGAKKVLQDLFSIQSDDIVKAKRIQELRKSNPFEYNIDGENNNDAIFQALFRSLCVEVRTSSDKSHYEFVPFTDSMITALAPRKLDTKNKNSLHDPNIFGFANSFVRKEIDRCRYQWGWIDLGCEIVHPFWIRYSKLANFLLAQTVKEKDNGDLGYSYGPVTQMQLKEIAEKKSYIKFANDGIYISSKKLDSLYETGIQGVVKLIKSSSLDKTEEFYRESLEQIRSEDDKVDTLRTLNAIDDWKRSGIKLTDYVISKFPIMPQIYRPELKNSGRNAVQDFDRLYEYIFLAVCSYASDKSVQSIQKIYDKIVEFTGLDSDKNNKSSFKSLLTWFTGKDDKNRDAKGKIRENILSKRVHYSGRTVIIPTRNTKMKPTEIGIPLQMFVTIYQLDLVELLHKQYEEFASDTDWVAILKAIASKNMGKFKTLIRRYVYGVGDDYYSYYDRVMRSILMFSEEQVVLSGRQPSLHKFSIRAYRPLITDGKAIEIHPLVCKGYNADFDGDQMWVVGLITKDAKEEALRLLSPKYGVINPKDSSAILDHSQDMRLGIYYATMLHNNVSSISKDARYSLENVRFYNSLELMKNDIECGILEPHDLVCFDKEDRKYLSTAGRIWFNSLLPNSFTDSKFTNPLNIDWINPDRYCELKYDALIGNNEGVSNGIKYMSLKKITHVLYSEEGETVVDNEYQSLAEFGFYFSDISGVSLTLDDLIEYGDTDKFIARSEELAEKINDDYYNGLLTEESRKKALISIYSKCKDLLQEKLIKEFDRNNNMFIMFDSGARGTPGQIMQTCGMIGVLSKTSNEALETPVLSNYTKGLSSFETTQASYGTRMAVSSTQNETANAGYATKQAVNMTNGFKIVESFCGKKDWNFTLEYTEPRQIYFDMPGERIAVSDVGSLKMLIGERVSTMDTRTLKALGEVLEDGNKITEDTIQYIIERKIDHLSLDIADICLEYKQETREISEFLLGKKLSSSDESNVKLLLNFLPLDNIITPQCVNILFKNKVKRVICEEGDVIIKYKLSPLMKNLLLNREAKLLPYLVNGTHISEKTINYIEDKNFDDIEVLTMLDCHSEGGVCAHCFGLKYDTNKLPKVGEVVGIESAQCLGEPAAQLTMNVVHGGGAAGTSMSSGVDLFKSLLNGTIPKSDPRAYLADSDGYVKITGLGSTCILELNGARYKARREHLLVADGEYVTNGTPLTIGYVVPDNIQPREEEQTEYGIPRSVILKRQLALLSIYYNTFKLNKIDINARHFEVLVRLQTSLVTVTYSKDEGFRAGDVYDVNSVLRAVAKGKDIRYKFELSKQKEVIKHFSGILTLLCFEDIPSNLAKVVIRQEKSYNNSDIGNLFIGKSLTNKSLKNLKRPIYDEVATTKDNYVLDEPVAPIVTIEEEEHISLGDLDFALSDMDVFADLGTLDNLDFSKESSMEAIDESILDLVSEEEHEDNGNEISINLEEEKPDIDSQDSYSEEERNTNINNPLNGMDVF